ncbi:MAG: adenylosuccinate synthase [Dehalococcoidia bacterium]|nr:adenylosuccinate synthase [Dehalococcoidia bacterium]
MPVIAVIGAQWGDEGKGKIVDLLAEKAHMVVRFSGGSNAGHTVVNPCGEFKMHLIPAGIFHREVTCIIGNGVVIDPAVFLEEIEALKSQDVSVDRLFVSDRAHLIMPYHLQLDALEEESRGSGAIGTTKRGIGPAYMDKVGRLGIRTGDLLERDAFLERLRLVLEQKNRILTRVYQAQPLVLEEIYEKYCHYGELLAPFIRETDLMVEEALERKQKVLLEGAQGTLLDVDFGTYPYVTSTTTMTGGACSGLGLSPLKLDGIAGVFKAYITRVGGGPMPTELLDETGELIREHAHERGATTGRPRRCGWFDAVVGRFSARVNGFSSFILTRLDILSILPSIKICTAYRHDGKTLTSPPSSVAMLARCEPLYEELPGWQTDISDIRRFEDLPGEARTYVERLEELLNCQASIISVGERREQTIMVKELL